MVFKCPGGAAVLISAVLCVFGPCLCGGQQPVLSPELPEPLAGGEGGEGGEAALLTADRFQIEGRAAVYGVRPEIWAPSAVVLVDGEEHVGFIRLDGSFTVNDVPSGSYVVQIASPVYKFEPVRVDITSKGKMRARRVNYIRTSEVLQLPYPLQIRCTGLHSYFIERETWGWSDFLMNPMVLMMVLPLVIILLLPKVINTNDPAMRQEMEQSMNMLNPNPDLPDVSELMTKFFAPPKSHSSSSSSGSGSSKSGGGSQRGHRGGPRRR
ncbi:ER membrane protein complex subunit 7-like [Astyanax mexicanus]|uniref:Endoplasmic reticulum membrane protein complex subunit 7 n=1 Tax=Astyanax mexicanus TaxID=7994 RepID=A0A8B9M1P3_ASTMX|nr:ER membrane protein complex subunit 7-like [Astyanax mexicanus]